MGVRGEYLASDPGTLGVPRLSVLMIRTALAYLATGFLVGALLLIHRAVPLENWLHRLVPLHIEYLLLGCLVQLALGVAFWVLPRFRSGAERGQEAPPWVAFALLTWASRRWPLEVPPERRPPWGCWDAASKGWRRVRLPCTPGPE